jgi:rhodanese-related sulfurtransferase
MKTLKDLIEEAHSIVPKISCNKFSSNKDKFFIVDVREASEIQETGMIEGAINIPRGLIEMKLTPGENDLDSNTPIVVYCGGGSRASLAGKTLKEIGFTSVQNLEGGFRGFKKFSS